MCGGRFCGGTNQFAQVTKFAPPPHVENREVGRPGQVDDRSEKLHVWLSQIETDAKALDAAATQKQLNVTSLVRAPKR